MVQEVPRVNSQPNFAFQRPRAAVAEQPRATLQAKAMRTKAKRVAARPIYQLPTGSLSWGAAENVILYSPDLRYETYDGGYARSPYGTNDYGSMYKGWPLRY
jgi:hypothetical protein